MTNLNAILQPAYEPGDGKADGAQLVDGEWWHPTFGCDSLQKVVDNVRSMRELPPNYIDPEHQGQDRELLEAFYQACRGEGGTADEIHLRGIKAALATQQTALPVPSALSEDWLEVAAVAAFAQDMRARGLAKQAHGDELLKPANQRATPVNLADLHDPDFSAGLSPGEHLNRLCGVAPTTLNSDREDFLSELYRIQEISLREGAGPRFNLVEFAMDHFFSGSPSQQEAPASAQLAAIAQLAEDPTDDSELLSTYHAARNDHQYNGMGDGWQWQAERAATVCGLRAVLARYGRPAFQPIPVSERLPEPKDCCPNPRNGQGQWCWGWVQPGGMDRDDPIPYSGCWRMMRWEWLSAEALAWAPWWAFPVPGATEMLGEVQP